MFWPRDRNKTNKKSHTHKHMQREKYHWSICLISFHFCVYVCVCESECLILPQQDYMPLKEHRISHKRYVFIQDLGQWWRRKVRRWRRAKFKIYIVTHTHTYYIHTYIHVDLLGHTSKNINKRPTNKQNHKIVHMYVYETHIHTCIRTLTLTHLYRTLYICICLHAISRSFVYPWREVNITLPTFSNQNHMNEG